MSILQVLFGLMLSATIGLLAFRRAALSASGVVGAILTGTATFGLGGLTWGLVLVAFFVSSSWLSHHRRAEKAHLATIFAKGERRDLAQTLANGGLGALLAVAVLLLVDLPGQARSGNPLYIFLAFSYFGAMAAVTADTWATELGVLAPAAPRLITTGREVARGTSGAVTWPGTAAALSGSLFIGLVTFGLIQGAALGTTGHLLVSDWPIVPIAALAGLVGSLVDSLLGATVQGIYWCAACDRETERSLHRCGAEASLRRGWPWMSNDVVNFLASLAGGLLAGSLGLLVLA